MARFEFLSWLRMLLSAGPLLRRIFSLLELPDWLDAAATRLWAVEVVSVLDELAEKTETQIDDQLVDAMRVITSDASAWAAVHKLILELAVVDKDNDAPLVGDDPRLIDVAEKVQIDPAILMLIITAAIELFKWWRERKEND